MAVTYFFAGVPTAGYDAALPWYERLFGRPPDFSPKEGEGCWRVGEGGWVYLVQDERRAGRALLTVLVDDLDAQLAELAARGLDAGPVETIEGAVRRVRIEDPEGNSITFGEVPGA